MQMPEKKYTRYCCKGHRNCFGSSIVSADSCAHSIIMSFSLHFYARSSISVAWAKNVELLFEERSFFFLDENKKLGDRIFEINSRNLLL